MRNSVIRRGLLVGAVVALTSAVWWSCSRQSVANLPDDVAAAMEKLPEHLDYTYDVKPILSDRCFACHGPDKAKQQAGLRLDLPESAYDHESEETGRRAIDPGDAEASDVVQRILSTDPKLMMPTPESHLSLSAQEKAVLIKWIEQGAEYQPHWAFVKPKRPKLPQVKNEAWVKNEIDRFVLKKLEEKRLSPAPEADRTTLLRRVSLDLTGLPPTVAEVDAFLKDTSPNAYEKVVDRLLASPHYGEHQAASWLDLARYADTHGYQDDGLRTMWPYRDWVIKAYNQNLSYDQFVTWQLAGDLLPNAARPKPTKDQLIATAFNRNHQQSQEGGIVPEEYHVEYVADRVNTFGKAFLAHTTECARCHDHKYDPISQKDYFSLFAFFNTVNEYGQIPYNGEPSPHITLPKPETEAKLNAIRARIAGLERQTQQDQPAARQRFAVWQASARRNPAALVPIAAGRIVHVPFDTLTVRRWSKEVEIKPSAEELKKNQKARTRKETRSGTEYKFRNFATDSMPMYVQGDLDYMPKTVRTPHGRGVYLTGESFLQLRGVGGYGNRKFPDARSAWFDRHEPFTLGLWVNVRDPKLVGPLINRNTGPFNGFRGYQCERMEDGRLAFKLSYVWPDDAIDVETVQPVPLKTWTHVAMSYDGSSRAEGLTVYLNGRPTRVRVVTDRLTQGLIYGKDSTSWGGGVPNVGIGQLHDKNYKGYAVDDLSIFNRALTPLEVEAWVSGRPAVLTALQRTPASEALLAYYLVNHDAPSRARLAERSRLIAEETRLLMSEPDLMVMREQRFPRKSHLLKRGAYDAPGEEVRPGVPSTMGNYPDELPRNRLGLAQWLLHEDNPLFARVTVNRFWQSCFGTGIVRTSDDFGSQGELPSHPELLDFLAVEFRESGHGWNVKSLLRKMVLSATYRQSSRTSDELRELDPDNRLLARGPSYRISAEQVRDNALRASGLLAQKIGGPSVHPYQPAGIWEALATRNAVTYEQNHGDSLYRRSMYTIWKRSSPPPMMLNFDAPDRSLCIIRRQKTSTPLQALVTLNDPQFVEAARVLAEQMIRRGGATPEARIAYAYKSLTSRLPRPQEVALLRQLYAEELADFTKNPKRAETLLTVGEYPFDKTMNPTELAANAVVASTIMNFDEFVIKR